MAKRYRVTGRQWRAASALCFGVKSLQGTAENLTFIEISDFEKESQNPLVAIFRVPITSLLSYPPLHKQHSL